MISKAWKLITPIISVVIGIWAANQFNLFELLPFIPQDYVYEVCITAYFTIADVVLDWISSFLEKLIKDNLFSELIIVIYQPNTDIDISITPTLLFNANDLSEACISVQVRGKKKHFEGMEVQIKNPGFADIQSNYYRNEVRVDDNNYYIDIGRLFGGNDYGEFKQEFRIVMAQVPVDGESISKIEPEISKKKHRVIYKHNHAKIKAVRR